MPRQLNSFLLRWWRGDESERLEIEHIQSGRKLLTSSIEDALTWLDGQMDGDQKPKDTGGDESAVSEARERSSRQNTHQQPEDH